MLKIKDYNAGKQKNQTAASMEIQTNNFQEKSSQSFYKHRYGCKQFPTAINFGVIKRIRSSKNLFGFHKIEVEHSEIIPTYEVMTQLKIKIHEKVNNCDICNGGKYDR